MYLREYRVQLDCGHDIKVKNYDNNTGEHADTQMRAAFKETECSRCHEITEKPHIISLGMVQ